MIASFTVMMISGGSSRVQQEFGKSVREAEKNHNQHRPVQRDRPKEQSDQAESWNRSTLPVIRPRQLRRGLTLLLLSFRRR
jgi:hypothetical protein